MCHKGCRNRLSHILSWHPVVPQKEPCHSQKQWGHVYSCGSWWRWITFPHTHSHTVWHSTPGRPKGARSRGAGIFHSWRTNTRTCCSGSGRPHSSGKPFSIDPRSGPRFPSASSYQASQVALVVKNPPTMQETYETWVQSLGLEDPLEEGMATHFSILGLENPMARGAWWASPWGHKESDTTEVTYEHSSYWVITVSLSVGLDALHI